MQKTTASSSIRLDSVATLDWKVHFASAMLVLNLNLSKYIKTSYTHILRGQSFIWCSSKLDNLQNLVVRVLGLAGVSEIIQHKCKICQDHEWILHSHAIMLIRC